MGILLRVDNLAERVTDDDLVAQFSDYGIVESAIMDTAGSTRPERRSACVVMTNDDEAQAAIDWLHETEFLGRKILVTRAAADKTADRDQPFWLHLDIPR
jgi:RNA recognition motif-containing protein